MKAQPSSGNLLCLLTVLGANPGTPTFKSLLGSNTCLKLQYKIVVSPWKLKTGRSRFVCRPTSVPVAELKSERLLEESNMEESNILGKNIVCNTRSASMVVEKGPSF